MSVEHLDTRIIDGKKELLFGPYAGMSTKFLKEGSSLDLFTSLRPGNIVPMLAAGKKNIPLTKYLVEQVWLTDEERFDSLKRYYPTARREDWELAYAGIRVQVIKKDAKEGGVLEFGTEIVAASDGSIAALLGASPGASTSVSIMLDLFNQCFEHELSDKIAEMIPSYGKSMADEPALFKTVSVRSRKALGL